MIHENVSLKIMFLVYYFKIMVRFTWLHILIKKILKITTLLLTFKY